ncbi:MAG: hypothetical protein Kow0042_29760 [Calditrichia bacterium]
MVNGTVAEPVKFTSNSGNSGGWKGIVFDDDSDNNTSSSLTHCIIENAGQNNSYNSNSAVYCYKTNAVFLNNCSIKNNGGKGIGINTSSPDVQNCIISLNGLEGIYIEGNSNPTIGNSISTGNDIYNNGIYDLYNSSSNNINALYNYWGTIDPQLIENKIYHKPDNPSVGEVFYNPWVDENHNIIGTPGGPPTQPLILLPVNGSEVMLSDYLVWTEGIDPYDSVFYHIQVDDDSLFGSPEINTYGLTGDIEKGIIKEILKNSTLTNLLYNAIAIQVDSIPGHQNLSDDIFYYWRVEAIDDTGGVSGYAPGQHYFFFNLTNSTPNPVISGFSPVNGELVVNPQPVISWNAASDPDLSDPPHTLHYILQLDDDGEFTNNYQYQYITNPGQNSYQISDYLSDNTIWYYRIQTVDNEGALSVWSPIQNFKTNYPMVFAKTVVEGWNLIGLPYNVFDGYYLNLFPGAITGTLFGWTGSYSQEDTLQLGKGYWLRFPTASVDTIEGLNQTSLSIDLISGWNLISGISCNIAISDVNDPGGIIIPGTLFGFNGSYYVSDSILTGNGYWLRTNSPGQISFSCSVSQTLTSILTKRITNQLDCNSYPSLSIRESSGIKQHLYFNVELDDRIDKLSYSLPPLPPEGAFDARFMDNYRIDEDDEAFIQIQSSNYPISISISNLIPKHEYQYFLVELKEGRVVGQHLLNEGNEITIVDPNVNLLQLRKEKITPKEFALWQNFPNPFNPTTTIKYALASDTEVKLEIYNSLGQKVITLVSAKQKVGEYSIEWDGKNENGKQVSSGIFFYKLGAGKYNSIRKMLFLK